LTDGSYTPSDILVVLTSYSQLTLDFVVNRFFMKLFKTNNTDVVKTSTSRCQASCGKNAPNHSILSSPVPKIFSVKLHRILFKFVLVQ